MVCPVHLRATHGLSHDISHEVRCVEWDYPVAGAPWVAGAVGPSHGPSEMTYVSPWHSKYGASQR